MAIVYYPKNTVVLKRDTISASYEQVVLSTQPNTILYFTEDGTLDALSASLLEVTASWAINMSGSITNATSASYAITSSYALNGGGSGTTISTGSNYPITSSWAQNSITASYFNQLWLITSSLYPITSSWSLNVISSSYSTTSSYALNGGGSGITLNTGSLYPITSSWSQNATSASYAPSSAGTTISTGSLYPITSSWANNVISSSYSATASLLLGSIESASYSLNSATSSYSLNGISSSYSYTSSISENSNTLDGLHSSSFQALLVTGNSYSITSSWSNNSINSTSASYYNQLWINTGSNYPITSSWSQNSVNSTTSSYFSQLWLATGSSYPITSSWSQNSVSASYAPTTATTLNTGSNYPITSSWAQSSINSSTASYFNQLWLNTGSVYPVTSSWSQISINSTSASYSTTSSYALNSGVGTTLNTGSLYPITSSWALTTTTASYVYLPSSSSILAQSTANYAPPHQEGRLFWDYNNLTYAVYNDATDVTLQLGQEQLLRVVAGENILNGHIVYVSGSHTFGPRGNYRPIVKLAIADGTGTKTSVIGVATHNISSGSAGWICCNGIVNDINTSGTVEGELIYLSSTSSGSFVIDNPLPPYETVKIGTVILTDASIGKIFVLTRPPMDTPAILSAGMTSIPSVSLSSSYVQISTGSVSLYNTSDGNDTLKNYFLQSASIALPVSESTCYVVAKYNSGSPIYDILTSNDTIDQTQVVNVSSCIKTTYGSFEYIPWGTVGYALSNKLNKRFIRTWRFARESGLALGESGSRFITCTSGIVWYGSTYTTVPASNTSQSYYRMFYHSASVWTSSLYQQYNNCFSDDTELLTENGFIKYSDIKEGKTKALTLNLDKDLLEYNIVDKLFIHTDKSEMIRYKSRCGDILVTPEHRMFYVSTYKKNKKYFECNALDSLTKSYFRIPLTSINKDDGITYNLPLELFKILGLIISDGHFHSDSNAVHISQKNNPTQIDYIENIIKKYTSNYKKHFRNTDNMVDFYFNAVWANKNIKTWISEKMISDKLMKLRGKEFRALLSGLIYGDGHIISHTKKVTKEYACDKLIDTIDNSIQYHYATINDELKDKLCHLATLNGIKCVCYKNKTKNGYIWRLTFSNRRYLQINKNRKSKIKYSGISWCVSVKNTSLVLRRGGLIFIAGNTQYDNGTNLATLSNTTRYGVSFVYRSIASDADTYVVLGTGDYTLTQAQASQPPANLPSMLSSTSGLAMLVGRIIVAKSAASATQIDSAFVTTFTPSPSTDHNSLSNLQGGTGNEYYHLTSNQYSNLFVNSTSSISSSFASSSVSASNADMLDGLHSSSFQALLVVGNSYPITSSWAQNSSVSNTASYFNQLWINTSSLYPITSSWSNNSINSISASYYNQLWLNTGSLYPVTSSWAQNSINCLTASYYNQLWLNTGSNYPITSSWTENVISASYSISASWAPGGNGTSLNTGSLYPITSSWAENVISASYSVSASWAPGGSNVSASYATTSSYTNGGVRGIGITNIQAITQVDYDALVTPDATTLYIISS